MEAVGLVLAVTPVIIEGLKSYKQGKSLTDRVRNRKRHVAELIRALNGHQATLEGYLQWVLKGADVDFAYDSIDDISKALSEPSVQSAIREFLGPTASRALVENLSTCEESILEIARSIDNFLPFNQAANARFTLASIASRYGACQEVTIWKGVKLALSRSELDTAIQKIDSATSLLDKLQSTRTAIGQLESNEPSKRSRRLAKHLFKTSVCAERLHRGLLAGWQPPCHSEHLVYLYLEDRVLDHASNKDSQKVKFHLIFTGDIPQPSGQMLWHENHVLVIDEDVGTPFAKTTSSRVPKVTIIAPSGHQATPIKKRELRNMCFSIGEAERQQTRLELFLLPHPKIHYAHTALDAPVRTTAKETISLERLIFKASAAQERSHKLPLKARLHLALTLASNTLQLSSTPWLKHTWSKKNVCFLAKAAPTDYTPATIDLTKPLLYEEFSEIPPDPNGNTKRNPGARWMLLELGIILLELWNETTLELHYTNTTHVVRGDYFTRLSLAQRWLEDSEDYMLPAYYDAAARCIRTQFDGCPVNPVWDETLRAGLVKSVIEPLQRQCKVDA